MVLPTLDSLKIEGKRVLLRLDLDVSLEDDKVVEDSRLKAAVPTIEYLQEQKASEIIILGHRGRPDGKYDENLTLKPIEGAFREILKDENIDDSRISFEENLRFDPGESFDSAQDKQSLTTYKDA